jgi:Sigma-70, region 4
VTSDAPLCARIRTGDSTAVRALLERHHAVVDLLVRAMADRDDTGPVLQDAWRGAVSEILEGSLRDGVRTRVLGRALAGATDGRLEEQATSSASPGSFCAAGDRWEGWWETEPPPWPPGAVPRPDQVLRALRRLPPRQRAVLVLRDVAGLSMEDVAAAAGDDRHLGSVLETARETYLRELDREVAAT